MLQITAEQYDAIHQAMLKNFIIRVARWLRQEYVSQTMTLTDKELDTLINASITKAKKWGIEIESDICRYIELVIKYGATFDQQSWASIYFFEQPLRYPSQILNLVNAEEREQKNLN